MPTDRAKIVRYIRLLVVQCEKQLEGAYGRGAVRYLRWVADDIEAHFPDELVAIAEDMESLGPP